MKINRIIKTRRKTLALIVELDGSLTVRAPLRATRAQIEKMVQQKETWILSKQKLALSRPKPVPRQFAEGDQFLFLGKLYPLALTDHNSPALQFDQGFVLTRSALPRAREIFQRWYVQQARHVLTERVGFYASQYGFQPGKLRISDARTRWGSCGPSGSLNFNWRLALAPLDMVDYVVVHELAHLRVRGHSKEFWQQVAAILPDFKVRKAWLKAHAQEFSF